MIRFFAALTILISTVTVLAQKPQKPQKQPQKTPKKIEAASPVAKDSPEDEKKVRDMVSFLEFVLNTLGNAATSARDKDVLITESYSKIFRDAQVQVEDDLDENRTVVTNKDVVAYLKDINFFFKDAKFEFTIDKVERGINADNQPFYKVSLQRNLTAHDPDGKAISNILARFIEINFNPKDQDLKIVSIYTHQLNEKEALAAWWKGLSLEWQSVFRKKLHLGDSVSFAELKAVTSVEDLDVQGDVLIQSLEPLAELKHLKILDVSGTRVSDLTPIRNLTELVDLNLSGTAITDLSALKYSVNLVRLVARNAPLTDIAALQRMLKLQTLDLSGARVADLSPIAGLTNLKIVRVKFTALKDLPAMATQNLEELNIAGTAVQDLGPVGELKNLKLLVCDSTRVKDLSALGGAENLSVLQANFTMISDIQPLQKLTHLEKIYCDQTSIKKAAADNFMAARPRVLVVYDSRDLKSWWDALSSDWKEVISRAARMSIDPPKEELARVGAVDSVNLSGRAITELEPLRKLLNLRVIIANKTGVHDLAALREHRQIERLNISDTRVTDVSPLSEMSKLNTLTADRNKIGSIDPLKKLVNLKKLYVDETEINNINAAEFLDANPNCRLVYKTIHIARWWRGLSPAWRAIYRQQIPDTTRESFHQLVELDRFQFSDVPVTDLTAFREFIRLKELLFSGTMITNVVLPDNLTGLKVLRASHGPIQNIDAMGKLESLENLDISNTPLEDLTAVWTLRQLKTLNCSGTQIKRLDALEKLEKLEYLDCSNTNVNKLVPLDYLHLKTLKCYNTRISQRTIQNYIASHPECKVIYYR